MRSIKKTCQANAQRIFAAGLSLILAASGTILAPASAHADDQDVINEWSQTTTKQLQSNDFQAFTSDGLSESVLRTGNTATSLDLRDSGLVTSVKSQSPWNTCWAFAAIAASETSILSSAKEQNLPLYSTNLSELQLAALAYSYSGVPESVAGPQQAGEGYYCTSKNPNRGINAGGSLVMASSVFAAGIGPVSESDAPYKNKDDAIEWSINGDRIGEAFPGATDEVHITNPREEDLKDWRDKYGLTCTKLNYAKTYTTGGSETEDSKEVNADWSVSSSLWQESLYEFANGNILPSTRIMENGKCIGTDMDALAAIKSELNSGRAVAVSIHADSTVPGAPEIPGQVHYTNNNWAHYTYNDEAANHRVTIVGYDDSYERTNFSDGKSNLPEGNGAWLVKNSYGSETEEFPNGQVEKWGLTDEDGNHTGYFWVSYYDKSVSNFETYEFDLSLQNVGASTGRIIDQYDYLPANGTSYGAFTGQVSSANIFTADADMAVRALWCETTAPNTTVTYDVYLLDSEAANPTDAEHSRKAFTASDTYDYGGYHRYKISDSDWIAMRSGQRYAVVVTQKHQNDSGAWIYTVPVNFNAAVETKTESSYDDNDQEIILEEWQEGFVAKVKAGESWVTSSVDDWTTEGSESKGSDSWTDWSLVTAELAEKNKTTVFDNIPIKAYAQQQSWASVEELAALEDAIASAEALLSKVKISADGTDVSVGSQWMTQGEFDALTATIANAKEQLALAGSDFRTTVKLSTPSPDAVASTMDALAVSAHDGTLQAAGTTSADAEKVQTAKTGDATGVAGAAAIAAALSGASLLTMRRLRRR